MIYQTGKWVEVIECLIDTEGARMNAAWHALPACSKALDDH